MCRVSQTCLTFQPACQGLRQDVGDKLETRVWMQLIWLRSRDGELDEVVITIGRNEQFATGLRNIPNGPRCTHQCRTESPRPFSGPLRQRPQPTPQGSHNGQEEQGGHEPPQNHKRKAPCIDLAHRIFFLRDYSFRIENAPSTISQSPHLFPASGTSKSK